MGPEVGAGALCWGGAGCNWDLDPRTSIVVGAASNGPSSSRNVPFGGTESCP